MEFRLCPTTQLLFDSFSPYLYRTSDGQAWEAEVVGVPPVLDILKLCGEWTHSDAIASHLADSYSKLTLPR